MPSEAPIAVPVAGKAAPKLELVPPDAPPAATLTFKLPPASNERACTTLVGFLPNATVPVGVAWVVPSAYCVPPPKLVI